MKKRSSLLHWQLLANMRSERVDTHMRSLSQSIRIAGQTEEHLRRQTHAKVALQQAQKQICAKEQAAFEAGTLRAADLIQSACWQVRAEQERARANASVDQAAQRNLNAQASVLEAQADVASAKADADVIARVIEKNRAARVAAEMAEMDEAGEEAFVYRLALERQP